MKTAKKRTTGQSRDAALRAEIAEVVTHFRQLEITQFAESLEIARLVFRAHPKLVKAREFPEPYHTALRDLYKYDPSTTTELDIGDLHITNPAKAARKWAKLAREVVRERAAKRVGQSTTHG